MNFAPISRRDGYEISTDPGRLDLDAVHAFLTTSYWSPGVPRDTVERAARGSLPFGLYAPDGAQVGYARVVSDGASFAWIADVYVLEAHRGHRLGVWLMETVLAHPQLRDLRRITLATKDAHGLYERFGFRPLPDPERYMLLRPGDR
jgi:GNAT superfamily N-acetyltransferase